MDNTKINPIFLDTIYGDLPALIQFSAKWCGPCQILSPLIDDISDNFQESLKVLRVDIDNNRELAAHYEINSVPTLLIFKNGEIIWFHTGLISPVELIKTIQSII